MKRVISLNENGLRIGEDHQRAKHPNVIIERVLELRDQGIGFLRIARITGLPKPTVRDVCNARFRCQSIAKFKTISVPTAQQQVSRKPHEQQNDSASDEREDSFVWPDDHKTKEDDSTNPRWPRPTTELDVINEDIDPPEQGEYDDQDERQYYANIHADSLSD